MGVPGVATVVRAVAGVDQRRSLPALASPREVPAASAAGEAPDVWLWLDTFTRAFRPGVARAAVDLLESAGQRVGVIDTDACCGLPLVTTGQLDRARRTLDGAVTALTAYAAGEVPVVGLEPSCLATLHDDAPRLVVGAEPLRRIRTLAAHLATLDWTPPDLTGVPVVAQPHCHHASVLDWSADEGLLRGAGAELTRVPGCCGLAGNFGMERGHYDVSVAVAETHLLPAVRRHPGAVVLADGLSCHHQLADLAGVPSVHHAELLAGRIPRPGGGFAS
jgi:Fe-S oxidoreductase